VKFKLADEDGRAEEPLEFDNAEAAAPSRAPSGAGSLASAIGARNLLIIIITMPFVFLVVVMTIIAVFGNPDKDRLAEDSATPGAVRSTPVATLEEPALETRGVVLPVAAASTNDGSVIALPLGGEAGAIALDGDQLAVRVDGENGAMIVIYNLAEDRVVKTVPLVEASGSAMTLGEAAQPVDLAEDQYANDGAPEAPSLSIRRGEDG